MMKVLVICCVAVGVAIVEGFVLRAQLPPYIDRCSKSDSKLNECFVRSGNRAIPFIVQGDARYNIPKMVPYKLKEVIIRNDNQLKFVLQNVRVYGLDRAQLTGVNLNFEQASFAQNLTIPRLTLLGDYELNGKVVDEFVNGKGRANITIVNGLYTSKMKFKTEENRAVPYGSYTYYKPQIVIYDLENLYDGNQFRGYQTNVFMNNNWREVNKVFERGAAKYMNDLITQLYKNIGSIATVNELYLP